FRPDHQPGIRDAVRQHDVSRLLAWIGDAALAELEDDVRALHGVEHLFRLGARRNIAAEAKGDLEFDACGLPPDYFPRTACRHPTPSANAPRRPRGRGPPPSPSSRSLTSPAPPPPCPGWRSLPRSPPAGGGPRAPRVPPGGAQPRADRRWSKGDPETWR